jgi:saccharopine dehydrogenase-like NADP-dependent oxidoreductase
MSALSVAVLGAGGTIAPAIVRDLAESAEAAELLLLDLDEARARAGAERHGRGKARSAEVDARGGLAEALADVDVLVNAASYRVNPDAMRACLEAGCRYLDLGGLYWMTGRQLELDEEFRSAGLLGLLGMGSSPGKTNVMAAAAVRKLGEPPRRVDVLAAGRDLSPPGGFSVPYALRTLVDEVTMAPVVLRDGEVRELEPLADGGVVRFPDPVREASTIHTLHSEIRTFGQSFGCEEASFRLALEPGLLERLRRLADAGDAEVEAAAREALPPSANTVSVHVVEAEGRSGRVLRCCATTHPMKDWGLGGGVVSTAAPAAAAARMMARGEIVARGVMPPERCVEPELLFPELARRNCQFDFELMQEQPVAG